MVTAVTVVAAVAGAVVLTVAVSVQQAPPQPRSAPVAASTSAAPQAHTPVTSGVAGRRAGARAGKPSEAASGSSKPATVGFSRPVSIGIPAIDVHAPVLVVGKQADGSVEPPPLTKRGSQKAAWYKHSADPGQVGPAIIEGHVDSAEYGPAVFYKLGALRNGDTIQVQRKDGTTIVFRVDKVRKYPKDDFPTMKVYGPVDHPALRLVSCGGAFNEDTGHYESNIIAFADLVAAQRR